MSVSPVLRLSGVAKSFTSERGPLRVLEDISLSVYPGELVSLVGPSGCGKSTLLNIVAGLDDATSGTVELFRNGASRSPDTSGSGQAQSAGERLGHVAFMAQKDLLLPWRSVVDNAILGLEVQGVRAEAARQRATALLETFGLGGFEREYPHNLSGGMRQRVAFLRTILADKPLVLLDEPFGALDALTRGEMQAWLLELWPSLGRAGVMVTHDVEEALLLSTRVYVLTARPARVQRVVEVPLPWPRQRAAAHPELSALKEEVLGMLWRSTPAAVQPGKRGQVT